MPGYTTFCTPCSLWELQQCQVLKLGLQLLADRREGESLGLKGRVSVRFYIVQMEKHERFTLLTCELPECSSWLYLCHLSDGTAWGHEVDKRRMCLGFPSLVLTYSFRVDQASRTMWFVLAAKEKQRCSICNGGQC